MDLNIKPIGFIGIINLPGFNLWAIFGCSAGFTEDLVDGDSKLGAFTLDPCLLYLRNCVKIERSLIATEGEW